MQFHPEVVHTPFGTDLLKAFLFDSCGCAPTWTPVQVIEDQVARIRAQVGDGRVVCALSGGVDSTVAALLVHRAIGDRLTCIFVDNGVLRLNEAEQVRRRFEPLDLPLRGRRASGSSSSALRASPIRNGKRKIIGATFIDVFEREAEKLGRVLSRTGHALSRRHRIGALREASLDQEPPQRRRPARAACG